MRNAMIGAVCATTAVVFYGAIQTYGSPAMAAAPAEMDDAATPKPSDQSELIALQGQIDVLLGEKAALMADRDAAKAAAEAAQAAAETAQAAADAAEANAAQSATEQSELNAKVAELAALADNVTSLEKLLADKDAEIAAQAENLAEVSAQLAAKSGSVAEHSIAVEELQIALAAKEAALDNALVTAAAFEADVAKQATQVSALKAELATVTNAGVALSEHATGAIADLRADLAEQAMQATQAAAKTSNYAAAIAAQSSELATLKVELASLTSSLASRDDLLAERDSKIAALSDDMATFTPLQNCQAEIDAIFSNAAITFATGTPNLTDPAKEWLDALVPVAQDCINSNLTLRIEGHTDSDGTESNNLQLSHARAISVRSYLEGFDLPAEAMRPVAFGEYDPIADNETAEGRAENRRIDFVWDMR